MLLIFCGDGGGKNDTTALVKQCRKRPKETKVRVRMGSERTSEMKRVVIPLVGHRHENDRDQSQTADRH